MRSGQEGKARKTGRADAGNRSGRPKGRNEYRGNECGEARTRGADKGKGIRKAIQGEKRDGPGGLIYSRMKT